MEARVAHIAIKGKLNNGTPIRRTRSQSAHGLATGPTPSSTPIDTPIITDNTVTTGDAPVNHHTALVAHTTCHITGKTTGPGFTLPQASKGTAPK
jgi:hypothetical protein